jgi:hypothetical protein
MSDMSASNMSFPDVLATLLKGQDLDDTTTAAVMGTIMRGDATAAQVAGLLMALRMKGETGAEIAGLVSSMREFALPVTVNRPVVDGLGRSTCPPLRRWWRLGPGQRSPNTATGRPVDGVVRQTCWRPGAWQSI